MAVLRALVVVACLILLGCASGKPGASQGRLAAVRPAGEVGTSRPFIESQQTREVHGVEEMPVLPDRTSGDDAKRAAARRIVELARAAFEDGRPEDTADLLERAVALDGTFSESYVLLAHLHMTEGSPELALAFLDRAEQLAARDRGSLAEVESSRGVVFEELGQWEAARDAYRRALRLAPENVRARNGLARVGDH